jgi:hypothetical protein
MTLREFLENIEKKVKEDPRILELNVLYSKDDEGNGFERIYYGPTLGFFDDSDREFYDAGSEDFEEEYGYTKEHINAICIN